MNLYPREAALFFPLFALRREDDLGIGDTESLRQMMDYAKGQGFSVLQILPVNETARDHSPYHSISAMALEPSTLQIAPSSVPALLEEDMDELALAGKVESLRFGSVQYAQVKSLKLTLLRRAYERFLALVDQPGSADERWREEYAVWCAFEKAEESWLLAYTFFRLFWERYQGAKYTDWPQEHVNWKTTQKWLSTLDDEKRKEVTYEVRFFSFVQWVAHTQWKKLQIYGRSCGVKLMGDMPFGISRFSADTWQWPELFDLKTFGGAPPEPSFSDDPFTAKFGQNWGIPIYNWEQLEEEDYNWLRLRVRRVVEYFDLFRIDHILGFYRIYQFPWPPEENLLCLNMSEDELKKKFGWLPRFYPTDDTSKEGKKIHQEQGEKLLNIVLKSAGEVIVIGEDLGMVSDYIRPSLTKLGISGFKIPLCDRNPYSGEYVSPEEYPPLSVATLATHDHLPMAAYWEECWNLFLLSEEQSKQKQHVDNSDPTLEKLVEKGTHASWEIYRLQRLARLDDRQMMRDYVPHVQWGLIQRLCEARSWLVIFGLTDLLGLKLRFNVPGSVGGDNWSRRFDFTVLQLAQDKRFEETRNRMRSILEKTGRIQKQSCML